MSELKLRPTRRRVRLRDSGGAHRTPQTGDGQKCKSVAISARRGGLFSTSCAIFCLRIRGDHAASRRSSTSCLLFVVFYSGLRVTRGGKLCGAEKRAGIRLARRRKIETGLGAKQSTAVLTYPPASGSWREWGAPHRCRLASAGA